MSDPARKDLTDKVAQSIQPDHTKSTTDHVSDTVTGNADKVARDAVPDSHKSTTQSVTDKLSREKDAHTADSVHAGDSVHTGESTMDKIKHVFGADKHPTSHHHTTTHTHPHGTSTDATAHQHI